MNFDDLAKRIRAARDNPDESGSGPPAGGGPVRGEYEIRPYGVGGTPGRWPQRKGDSPSRPYGRGKQRPYGQATYRRLPNSAPLV